MSGFETDESDTDKLIIYQKGPADENRKMCSDMNHYWLLKVIQKQKY